MHDDKKIRRWRGTCRTQSLSHHTSAAGSFDVSLMPQQTDTEKPMSRISAGLQVLVLVAGAAATGVEAQGLVTTHKWSAALANELGGESVAQCAPKGYSVVAVVVDLDGVRQALLRGN